MNNDNHPRDRIRPFRDGGCIMNSLIRRWKQVAASRRERQADLPDPEDLSSHATTRSDARDDSSLTESSLPTSISETESSLPTSISESDWSPAPTTSTVASNMSIDGLPLEMDLIPVDYDPFGDFQIDHERNYELVMDRMHQYLGQEASVDIDNINFVVQSDQEGEPFTPEAKRIVSEFILHLFGFGTLDMYTRKPLSDRRKWQIHDNNPMMRFSRRHETLLIHKPVEVALLVTEIEPFMANHFVPQKPMTILNRYRQKGFIVDPSKLRNPPTVVDFVNAFLDSDLSYLHFSLAGQRHKIGGPIDVCGMIFNHIQHFIDHPDIQFNFVQVDVAVETLQTEISEDELPQWGVCYQNNQGILDHKLGPNLGRRCIPSWHLHGRSNVMKEKYGSVNLEWGSYNPGENEQHHGRESRGVYKVKCYTTHAHYTRNFLGSYADPSYDFHFTTVKHAKNELMKAEDDVKSMMDYRNIRHRCEVVWVPNSHYQTIQLLQLINLALWVRVHVLADYRIAPVPTGLLPKRSGILIRTFKVIIQMRKILHLRDSTALTSRNIGRRKMQWFSAMYSLMLSGLGLQSVRIFQIFHRWMDSDTRVAYDPQGWHALLNPYDGWIQRFNNEHPIMDESMNFREDVAANYLRYKLQQDAINIVGEDIPHEALDERYNEVLEHLRNFNQNVLDLIHYAEVNPWVSTRVVEMMPGQAADYDDLPSLDSANINEEVNIELEEEVETFFARRVNLEVHQTANQVNNIPHIDIHDEEIIEPPQDEFVRGTMEWWNWLNERIIQKLARDQEYENYMTPLEMIRNGIDAGFFSLVTIVRICNLLGVRVQRNQRRKDACYVLLQEKYE